MFIILHMLFRMDVGSLRQNIVFRLTLCLMQVDHAGDENKKQKAGWKMQALLPTSFHPASCEILYDQPANPMQDHTA